MKTCEDNLFFKSDSSVSPCHIIPAVLLSVQCVALHCAGSRSPRVSAAGPEPLVSSLQSPDGSSAALNLDPAAR